MRPKECDDKGTGVILPLYSPLRLDQLVGVSTVILIQECVYAHKSLIVSTFAGCSVLLPSVFHYVNAHPPSKLVKLTEKSFSMYFSIKSSVTSSLLAWPSLVTSISFTGAALFSTKASGEWVAIDMCDYGAARGRLCVFEATV